MPPPATTPRRWSTSSAMSSSRSLPLTAARGARRGRPCGRRRVVRGEADPPAPARLRRPRAGDRGPGAGPVGGDQARGRGRRGAGAARGAAREPARAALRAQGAAPARPGGIIRGGEARRPVGRSRDTRARPSGWSASSCSRLSPSPGARRRSRARPAPRDASPGRNSFLPARWRRSRSSTGGRCSTRGATRRSRSRSCSTRARAALRPCPRAPRPGSSRPSSSATAATSGAERESARPSRM